MKKIVRVGNLKGQGDIFCRIEIKDGKLSISGVIGPKGNGDCHGGCGQIDMEFEHRNPEQDDDRYSHPTTPDQITFAPGWDTEKWFDFLDVWKNWHLNDTRPNCEHQEGWGKKKLELIEFGWTTKFHQLRTSATEGKLDSDQYDNFKGVSAEVLMATISINHPKWKSPLIEKLLAGGWIEEKKREMKTSGWVYESEHPEGELSKPCPVCGYKYGTAWLVEPLPEWVITFLKSLPDTDKTPAWV